MKNIIIGTILFVTLVGMSSCKKCQDCYKDNILVREVCQGNSSDEEFQNDIDLIEASGTTICN